MSSLIALKYLKPDEAMRPRLGLTTRRIRRLESAKRRKTEASTDFTAYGSASHTYWPYRCHGRRCSYPSLYAKKLAPLTRAGVAAGSAIMMAILWPSNAALA